MTMCLPSKAPRQFGKFHLSQKPLKMSTQSAASRTGRNSSTRSIFVMLGPTQDNRLANCSLLNRKFDWDPTLVRFSKRAKGLG